MNNIDTFLNEWNSRTTNVEGNKYNRQHGNLIIQLSKSGRTDVVRLNYLRSSETNKGEASKFIDWLNTQSDKFGFAISVCAQSLTTYGGGRSLRKEQIVGWLKKHGYKVRYEYPDGTGVEMGRADHGGRLPITL